MIPMRLIAARVRLSVSTWVVIGLTAQLHAQTDHAPQPLQAVAVPSIQGVGSYTVTDTSGSGAVKLSGITYAGGATFFAVGGGDAKLYTMHIRIDRDSGAIHSAKILTQPLQLRDENGSALGHADLEGVAFGGSSVYVANEDGPEISRHDLATGKRLAHATTTTAPQLNVFAKAVDNRAWESLARSHDGSVLWTANEEALTVDGDLATTSKGTVVRLQRFDADLKPCGQWAYVTDPIQGRSGSRYDRAGVVDLAVLDDGRLLVLERSTGKGFRIQLMLVDCTAATDISKPPFRAGLRNQSFQPVTKTKLFVKDFTTRDNVNAYFVGITLGPVLRDGGHSVILIADNGGMLNFMVPNNEHRLYALKIAP